MAATLKKRAVIIDLQDGPCDLCAVRVAGKCNRCQGPFKSHAPELMGEAGYQSVGPSHFHLEAVEGIPGRKAYWDELCIGCYRKDYMATYGRKAAL